MTLARVTPAAASTSRAAASGPAPYDLRLYRGDTYAWRFVLWADAEKTQAVDLTGFTAAAEIRDRHAGTRISTMTCVIELPNVISVTLPAALSRNAPVGRWDLELTNAAAEVVTVVAGAVAITDDITNSTGEP